MRTFVGYVAVFNGRFERKHPVRVEASGISAAIGKAYRAAPKKPRERVEGVTVKLEALRGPQIVEISDVAPDVIGDPPRRHA
jgi:hypothetical protein